MPFSKQRNRPLAVIVVAAGLFAFPIGCETVRPEPAPEPVARSIEPSPPVPLSAPPTLPGKYATRRGCCVFYHDFELEKAETLFAELEALPDQVYGELKLPPSNTIIQVFLFDSQERYERYMFLPKGRYKLPNRRAYFITEPHIAGSGDDLKVFTWMSNELRTDLRHELTHALLHAALKDVPLWLDEGLAGYFEIPPNNNGVNFQHLEMLRRGPFLPDMAKLEKLDQVAQMQKPEYREAWAWVHLMLKGDPEVRNVLLGYMQALRTTANPGPLLPRLREALPDPDQALADYLAQIELPRSRNRTRDR